MKIFLYDAETDYKETDYEVELDIALDEFYELSDTDGSFFGVMDNNDKILQFAWEGDDKWLVDIPIEPGKYSLQKYVSYDEGVDLIKGYYQGKNLTEIAGLHRVPIMEATLDEVLAQPVRRMRKLK